MQTVSPLAAIPVFYDARMVADAQSYSPSAGKPREVVESWKALRLPLAFESFSPLPRGALATAHTRSFVDGVLEGRTKNGFGNCLMAVANTLPWTSGAMLAAACEALANRQVAVAPVSGFHHARHDHAAGYCTFNGLIVAARVLLAERRVTRVGILDCDMHYGDGTEQIIRHLGLSASIKHVTVGRDFVRPAQAEQFLRELPEMVADFQGCDVILYQAGADPHVDDPLGGWLTNTQLAQRDRTVFEHCKWQGIPVAWNLAGGYQTPLRRVLDIHDATLQACIEIYLDQPQQAGLYP
jgi:acetoin utilization deacetylase AcuC-like enzyme